MDIGDTPSPGPGRTRSVVYTSLVVAVVIGISALGFAAWVALVRWACA